MKGFIRNKKYKHVILNLIQDLIRFRIKCSLRPSTRLRSGPPVGVAFGSGMTASVVALFCLSLAPTLTLAEDLLADEQGPTAFDAVETVTANTDFLAPTYTAPAEQPTPVPSEVDILNEIFGSDTPVPAQTPPSPKQTQRTFTPQNYVQRTDTPLLTPLPPQPVFAMDTPIPPKQTYFNNTSYADQVLATSATAYSPLSIPREIRITFYPGKTAFSAQALKWAKAFATHVVNDPRLLVEIRVSEEDWSIQEKRLSILLQILKESGVSAHQIRLFKTARDANSILMGYANNPDLTLAGNDKNLKKGVQKTISW